MQRSFNSPNGAYVRIHRIHGSLGPRESKRHLDRFRRFCVAHPFDHADRQTDRQTDDATSQYDIPMSRLVGNKILTPTLGIIVHKYIFQYWIHSIYAAKICNIIAEIYKHY